jgi:guanine deaminase
MQNVSEEFLRQAIELALENVRNGTGGPFGAIVVKDGIVVGKGMNRVTLSNDPTAHAEINAIREACKQLNTFSLQGCHIYTSCEPCPMCLGAIYWSRLDMIVFASTRHDAANAGFDDDHIYRELPKPHNQRSIIMTNIEMEEAMKVFDMWRKSEGKIKY